MYKYITNKGIIFSPHISSSCEWERDASVDTGESLDNAKFSREKEHLFRSLHHHSFSFLQKHHLMWPYYQKQQPIRIKKKHQKNKKKTKSSQNPRNRIDNPPALQHLPVILNHKNQQTITSSIRKIVTALAI